MKDNIELYAIVCLSLIARLHSELVLCIHGGGSLTQEFGDTGCLLKSYAKPPYTAGKLNALCKTYKYST